MTAPPPTVTRVGTGNARYTARTVGRLYDGPAPLPVTVVKSKSPRDRRWGCTRIFRGEAITSRSLPARRVIFPARFPDRVTVSDCAAAVRKLWNPKLATPGIERDSETVYVCPSNVSVFFAFLPYRLPGTR